MTILRRIRRSARNYLSRRLGVPEIPLALEGLRARGFDPMTIFDVGAYSGEFAKLSRRIWPLAHITCFEVLPARVSQLQKWCDEDGNSAVIDCLLGSEERDAVPFHEMETASSVLKEHEHKVDAINSYKMRTIDAVVEIHKQPAPDLLKLDVQGFELEVLKGAKNTLARMSAIIAEVNLIDIHQGVPMLDEFVSYMRTNGFVAYDICGLTRRPLDHALWQTDFIFVPRDSVLRADKRWQS